MIEETPQRRTTFKTVLVFLMLFAVLGAVVVFATLSFFTRPITTIILVRHAEKSYRSQQQRPGLERGGTSARARAGSRARRYRN